MQKTLYQIIGVTENASQDEIQRMFGALRSRLQERADRGDGEAINQLKFANDAFAILREAESRRVYDEKLASIRAMTSAHSQTMSSAVASGRDIDDEEYGDGLPRVIRQLRAFLGRRPAAAVAAVLLPIVVAIGLWALQPTEKDRLHSRATEYMALFRQLNFEAAYDYLTPDLRDVISRDAYVQGRSADLGVDAKIVDVEVTVPAQKGYAVVESREGKTRLNWVMIDGEWYRDLASDRSDVVRQLVAMSSHTEAMSALPVPLGLWNVSTRWNRHQTRSNGGTTRYFVLPVTAFHVMNEGREDIRFLEVMVEYYDTEADAIFGTVSGNLVNFAQRPLGPRRMVRWISGDLNLRYEMEFGQWAEATKNQPVMVAGDNPVIDRIEVRIFARQDPKAKWTRLQ